MIGLFKTSKHRLDKSSLEIVKRVHCTGCIQLKDSTYRSTTLFYPYETDLLIYLSLGTEAITEMDTSKCTGLPLLNRKIISLSSEKAQIINAFTVICLWCYHSDQYQDRNSRIHQHFLSNIKDRITWATDLLDITDSHHDPRTLSIIQEEDFESFDEYLNTYVDILWGIWFSSIKKTSSLSDKWAESFSKNISKIQLLADAVMDLDQDKKKEQFNPLINFDCEEKIIGLLQASIRECLLLLNILKSPYKEITKSIFQFYLPAKLKGTIYEQR